MMALTARSVEMQDVKIVGFFVCQVVAHLSFVAA
jgi:hypothetical protein